jgi:transcriptional regulator with XRE-family HTH domain
MPERPPSRADLGRAVRRLRLERAQTIEELAGAARMHPTYLSGIERGRYNPSWDKLGALASALDISLSELVQQAEQASSHK